MYWFYVLPLGFLLTQYTITGFDSCAHISEETHGAADSAAKGVWRSIFYSALIGWFLLLAHHVPGRRRRQNDEAAAGGAIPLLRDARWARGCGQARPDHLDRRPAVLRHGVPDQRVAHVLRVQPRRRDPGLADLEQGQRAQRCRSTPCIFMAVLRGDHHDPGVLRQRGRHPGGVLRRRLDRRHRPLHRLRRSRSTCAGGWATRSRPGRGATAASTSG